MKRNRYARPVRTANNDEALVSEYEVELLALALTRGQQKFTIEDMEKVHSWLVETKVREGCWELIQKGMLNLSINSTGEIIFGQNPEFTG